MEIARRIEKARRYWRWRFADRGRTPLYWHIGRPNFGDDINPSFFEALTGARLRFALDRNKSHVLGVGSVLAIASPYSTVAGSGFLYPPRGRGPRTARLVAVRGALSLAAFDPRDDVYLGDPLALIDQLIDPPSDKTHRFGLIPHVSCVGRFSAANGGRLRLIDPALPPWKVAAAIGACEAVFSQSLHGLIVADALRVPNAWIAPAETMAGGRFKFDDYFTTLDLPKEMIRETSEIFARPEVFDFAIGTYRYSKDAYRSALTAAVRQVGADAAGN
jgi:pyruvyltransferase